MIDDRKDRKRIEEWIGDLVSWSRSSRREGRPPADDNILIYHLANSLTVYRLKRSGLPMRDKRGWIKMERRWDDVARVLLWIHFKRMPIAWTGNFVRSNSKRPAIEAMTKFKKTIQRKYAHLGPPSRSRDFF